MNRYVISFILLTVFFSITGCNSEQEPLVKLKPNVIFIMADDLGYGDLGAYGQLKIQTPRLDQMAAQGLLFTQFYAGTAVCAPLVLPLSRDFIPGIQRLEETSRMVEGMDNSPCQKVPLP